MRLVNNSSVRFLDQFVGCRLAFVEKAVSIFETLKQLTGMDSLLDICSGFDESYIANIQKYHSFSKKLSSLSTKLSDAISKINSFSDLNSLPAFELYNPNAVLGLGFLRSATVINLTSALNSCLVVDMNILNGNPDLDVFVNSHLDMANKIFDLVQQVKQVIGINDWMIIRMNFKSLFPLSFKDNMIRSSNYSQGLSLINDRLREIEAKISSVVPDNTNFVRQSSVASSSTDSLPGLSARSSRSSSTPTLPM